MANLIIQENGVERVASASHGEVITIQAPCDCSAVTGVQIAGVVYPFYDACGTDLSGSADLFSSGNLIRVLIDTVNVRATLLNPAGVAPPEKGGTGKTTLRESANALINALSTGTSAPKDDDYMITQYVGGGDSNTSYYRRKMSYLWTWIKDKADDVYAALTHTHAAGDITSGTLGVARGGTGVTANPSMLTNLASTSAASVFAASPRPGVTGTLPAANGGTGQTTVTPAVGTKGVRQIYAGTSDMTAGTSTLTTGVVYFVYE